MRIYPVTSEAQLKPLPADDDPYQRSRQDEFLLAGVENGSEPEYEVERILDKQYNLQKKKFEYLVKWMGYRDEWNSWLTLSQLENAKEAVQDYEDLVAEKSKRHTRGRSSKR